MSDELEEIQIELTPECNLACPFCVNNNNIALRKGEQTMPTDVVLGLLDQIAQEGIPGVRFTGGEPFMREDLAELCRHAKKRGLYVIVNSNGTMCTAEHEAFNYMDAFLLSINFFNDVEKKQLLARTLSQRGTRVLLDTVMSVANIRLLDRFYELAASIPHDEWLLLREVPTPEHPSPTPEALAAALKRIPELNKKHGLRAFIANALPYCLEPEVLPSISTGAKNDDGHTRLVVDPFGTIKPSYYANAALGKVGSTTLRDAWKSIAAQTYRSLPKPCEGCMHAAACRGGLRHAALMAGKDMDPLARPELVQQVSGNRKI
ncbi:radical SAM protein [Candidatus Woesearchaeota archaeon]|nr:radical SAM protein [Candidatus Woesearchaeota archaeon]